LPLLLDLWLADPVSRALAIEMYRASGGSLDVTGRASSGLDADRVLKTHLKEAFRRGALLILPQALNYGGSDLSESEEVQGQTAGASGRAPGPQSWIEIYLRDDEGQPVAGERYRIKMPDGHVEEGTLDSFGHAEYYGINPGTCEVSFPGLKDRSRSPA
jgi:hypothetical protein